MSGWQCLGFSLLASQTGVLTTVLPRISSHHICVPPLAPPPLTSEGFMSICLHVGPKAALEFLLFTPPPAVMGSYLSFPFSFPLPLGIDSDVECLGTSTRIYCLHCFLCMTLYAVSMLKKKRKEEKTLSKINLHVLDKKKKKRLYSQCPTRNYVAASLCFWPLCGRVLPA